MRFLCKPSHELCDAFTRRLHLPQRFHNVRPRPDNDPAVRQRHPVRVMGVRPGLLRVVFFTLLSACTVAALQTVGAFLVIAMVVTPGATAYLLTDRFGRLIVASVAIGTLTSFAGAYASYFIDGATGGIIVVLQTLIFLAAFVFAPKHGMLAARRRAREALEGAR